MKKHGIKMTNAVGQANWNKVTLTQLPNNTTNSVITPLMFKRECEEYDAGVLPFEHDRYLGDG